MELEFDKEIDALLRKARSGTSVAAVKGGHLDADAMNAFAEGAVPDAVRKTYTAHVADCDSCRKALSQIALLNEPIAMKAAAAAAAPAPAAPARAAAPWYRSLFRSPGLAAAMGVLVLAFGATLVYLLTQRGAGTPTSVAMQKDVSNSAAPIPYAGIESNSNAAAASNATSTMSNTASANSAVSSTRSAANAASNSSSTGTTANAPAAGSGLAAPSGGAPQQPVA
ncbi:MAG: hypothetical protein ACJ73D_11615, partial [Pyrinomonadaceae bacterium]